METVIIIAALAIFFLLLIGFIYYQFNKKFQELAAINPYVDSFQLLNQNIQGMHERLDQTQTAMGERLDNAARVIGTVSKELGQVQEIGRQMQTLQDFLKSPKLRGNIGEQVLRDLLEQFFSKKHFELQYRFNDGQIVDAILRTASGIIPIDSKFPLENFQKMSRAKDEAERTVFYKQFIQDVKKHIQDISKKYILPGENTVDFAVMYIPSEAVYYEIIRDEVDMNAFAYSKKIFPVSPNSFYYFLRVLMMGIEGQKIQEGAKKILGTLQAIQKESEKFTDEISVVNSHLTHATTALGRLSHRQAKFTAKIDQISMLEDGE